MPQPMTLQQLLESRDARAARQCALLSANPGKTLVVLTVIVPGPEKRTPDSLVAARAAVGELRRAFGDTDIAEYDLDSGFEAYLLTDKTPEDAKRICVGIEERHPLGRVFDLDVMGEDGIPLTRASVGMASRRCLICDSDARVCMRLRTHGVDELLSRIHSLTETYLRDERI